MATQERATRGGRSSREALAETWFDQATSLLERIRDHATESELEEALSQPTSISGIGVLLSGAADSVAEFDGLAPALLRGVREQGRLLDEAGGALFRSRVASLLGITPEAVDQRRRRNRLLFVETLGGHYGYPQIQFTGSGTLPHLTDVLGWMHVEDGWMRLDMFLSELDALGGRTPVEVLTAGPTEEELDELRSVMQSWGV